MFKEKRDTIIKVIIQLISLILFSESFVVSLFAIRVLVWRMAGNEGNINVLEPVIILAATIPSTIILGRYYCGYICGFGAMQDFFGFVARKIYKALTKKELKYVIKPKAERFLGIIKYGVLAVLLICYALDTAINPEYDPWTAFGRIVQFNQPPDFSAFVTIGGLVLLLIIVLSLFEHRVFCRYICPMGAIYTLISRFAIGKKEKDCPNQGNCCICKYKCKKKSVNYISLFLTLAVFVAANVVLLLFVYKDNHSYDFNAIIKEDGFRDGTYTGTGEGYKGAMEVTVIVEDGLIKEITIDKSKDDKKYKKKVTANLIPLIIENQSVDVDAISGATYSSRGLLEAVKDALSLETVEDNPISDIMNIVDNEEKLSNLEDGVYEGNGEGFRGDIKVEVTVSNHKVEDIRIISYYDNEEYLFFATPIVLTSIEENQSLNVDAISGATYSKNGLIKAVANALGISEEEYQLQEERVRAEKNKGTHHVTQKFVESEDQYAELTEKYKDLLFGPDGLKVN